MVVPVPDARAVAEFRAAGFLVLPAAFDPVPLSEEMDRVLADLWPQLRRPLVVWSAEIALPAPCESMTLLIRDVPRLSRPQQKKLLTWLDSAKPRTIQVVSTTALELFRLVEEGIFLDRLYYRLNVMRLDVVTLFPANAEALTHKAT